MSHTTIKHTTLSDTNWWFMATFFGRIAAILRSTYTD